MTDNLFFKNTNLELKKVETIVNNALHNAEDGELFLEYAQSEFLNFEDGNLKEANFNIDQGFGFRAVHGEISAYAHSNSLHEKSLRAAAETIQTIQKQTNNIAIDPALSPHHLYTNTNPLLEVDFKDKVDLLQKIDAYARALDPRIKQVMCSVSASWRAIQIIRLHGHRLADIRPLIRFNISVIAEDNNRQETGGHYFGGRFSYKENITFDVAKQAVDKAFDQALIKLKSHPAPAGEMVVVLGPGWPGILLHEAIGHGLEGDFNRKKTSAFSNLLGQKVAADGVTVVDDGTLANRRGSLSIDDEGTPTQRTVLIENGILVGYLQDRQNARLMGVSPTGNGRRQSYAHCPMPRMTNTMMDAGSYPHEEIIRSVKKGLYATNFSGGQVDITSGKFVFSAAEAYLIEDGKITAPVKGATLIGNGPDVLKKVSMIGNNVELDLGIGTCGKNGQSVPVGVGQPTLRIDGLTVGGTAT
ncbi:MAG: metalloprotease TldD [Alphaproteobacteria bacterium]|nr:metalloprotease TldD [Alphaproteobacteria bacterium]